MIEIARTAKGKNNIETARGFAKCEAFKGYQLSEIIATMRSYKRSGWLVLTETEAILYHDYDA